MDHYRLLGDNGPQPLRSSGWVLPIGIVLYPHDPIGILVAAVRAGSRTIPALRGYGRDVAGHHRSSTGRANVQERPGRGSRVGEAVIGTFSYVRLLEDVFRTARAVLARLPAAGGTAGGVGFGVRGPGHLP